MMDTFMHRSILNEPSKPKEKELKNFEEMFVRWSFELF